MANSQAIIAAAKDADVRERAIALAAEMGVENPSFFVDSHLYQLASAPVVEGGDSTVASVYEYAQAQYEQKAKNLVAPGKDMAVVTDNHLRHAINTLISADTQ